MSVHLEPQVIPRAEHKVSRKLISQNALKVLNRLHEAGHEAYLVGGGVRDILTGIEPKDFDVATDAEPEEVRELFKKNSRIIGRRFRLVHVLFGRDMIEVATFRAGHDIGAGGEVGESGRILRDNVFGTIEQDAARRDFTVNALYYNIADFAVTDFVGGLQDIERRVFRLIGDPVVRCEEDPVRVIRAARLAAKLDFEIDEATADAMWDCAELLVGVPAPRMFEEVLKLFQGGYAVRSFVRLEEHDLLGFLFPATDKELKAQEDTTEDEPLRTMLIRGLRNTDSRIQEGKPVTPAYLLAFLLWSRIHAVALEFVAQGTSAVEAIHKASDQELPAQLQITAIPRRFSGPMREIWTFQPRLEQYTGSRALDLIENRRFRAAYDFLCLRATVDTRLSECADWWTRVQEVSEEEQIAMSNDKVAANLDWKGNGKPKRKRRRSNRKSA